MDNIPLLTVADLKMRLRQRGLVLTGNKATLVARLQEVMTREQPSTPPPPREAITRERPFVPEVGEMSTLDEAVYNIPIPDGERLPASHLFRLALAVTPLSLVALGEVSPYVKELYDNDDFWQLRWRVFSGESVRGGTLKPPPSPFKTWREYGVRIFTPGYVKSDEGVTTLTNHVWRSLLSTPSAGLTLEVNVSPYANVPFATRTYFGYVPEYELWVSFVNHPGSGFEYIRNAAPAAVGDLLMDWLPSVRDIRYVETATMPLDVDANTDVTIDTIPAFV